MLSERAKTEYVENGGVVCPYCGSGNLDGGFVEIDGGGASQTVRCLDCYRSWTDLYTLTEILPDVEASDG